MRRLMIDIGIGLVTWFTLAVGLNWGKDQLGHTLDANACAQACKVKGYPASVLDGPEKNVCKCKE